MKVMEATLRAIERAITWIAYALLILMVINTAGGVFFRYVLRNAISWTEELGRYMMVYVGFLGCVLATRDNSHVGVEMFTDLFRPGAKRVFKLVARLVVTGFLVAILFKIGPHLASLNIQRSSALLIPMAIPYAAVAVGVILMLLENLAHTVRLLVNPAAPKAET
ncbi:MAG: TRAP transporter small permease [Spirochaetes bacterium]|nr:TRAP transporter small permease [Spirochaetota bacterium]